MKEHHFVLVVKSNATRKSAELAVLSAFGRRQPDYCEFYLRRKSPPVRKASRKSVRVATASK